MYYVVLENKVVVYSDRSRLQGSLIVSLTVRNGHKFRCLCPQLSVLSIRPVSPSSFQLIHIKCLTATNSKLLGCLPFILIKLCCLFAVFLLTPIPCCPLPHLRMQAGWNTCSDVNYTHIRWHLLFSWKKEILPLGGTSGRLVIRATCLWHTLPPFISLWCDSSGSSQKQPGSTSRLRENLCLYPC